MAYVIARPIKVHTNTLKVEREKFARVCVEVDLTEPSGRKWVNDHWDKVQYEDLYQIYTNCGCYGHLGRNFTLTTANHETKKPPHQQITAANHPLEIGTHQNQNIPNPVQPLLIHNSHNGKEMIASSTEKSTEKWIN